jgi:hypothetical protein
LILFIIKQEIELLFTMAFFNKKSRYVNEEKSLARLAPRLNLQRQLKYIEAAIDL